uniref:Retrotrans_gag domain-containing protein n=1 Tax=Globodera pallida TaxID=36090 RepID=A0A183CKB0_GLOPA
MDIDQLRGRIAALEREVQTSTRSSGLPFPTLYDGSEDFQQYLKNFNTLRHRPQFGPLRGARKFYRLPEGRQSGLRRMCDAERTNWMSLVDALADKLKRMSSSLTARQKLAQRKQRPGETLEEFAQAVNELVARAYPDHSLEMNFAGLNLGAHEKDVRKENEKMLWLFRSGVARDFFRANMLPQLKEKALYMKEPRTLEEALTQAKRVEQIKESLMEDIWKQAQGTKAEIALAEVNAVCTELNELRKRQRRWDEQRRPEHDWDEDCQRDWEEDCHHDGEEDCERNWEEDCERDWEEDCYHDAEEDCERDGEKDCQYDWEENCHHGGDED